MLLLEAGHAPVTLLAHAAIEHDRTGVPLIVSGNFDHAAVVTSGLSAAARALLAVGAGLGALTAAVVSAAIAYFLIRLLRGTPFHRSLVVSTIIAGAALSIGNMLAQFIGGFGRMQAAVELNPVAGGVFEVGFALDPVPILVGFVVLALGYVFQFGARLQRDTEGLV